MTSLNLFTIRCFNQVSFMYLMCVLHLLQVEYISGNFFALTGNKINVL